LKLDRKIRTLEIEKESLKMELGDGKKDEKESKRIKEIEKELS